MSSDAILGMMAGVALTLAIGSGLALWENLHVRRKGRGAHDQYGQPMAWGLALLTFGAIACNLVWRLV